MATGPLTQVADIVVPELYTPYQQQQTEEKSRLVVSGALVRAEVVDNALAGGGRVFNIPSFQDLDSDEDNVSTDAVADIIALSESGGVPAFPPGGFGDAIPLKIQTSQEVGVRLSRNQSWSAASLAGLLAGADPMAAIASRTASYWQRALQRVYVSTWIGVSQNDADGAADLVVDIGGATFQDGTTNFSAEAVIDAAHTMGDSVDDLAIIMVHNTVYARMKKNNLIDFIPDSEGRVNIPTYQGMLVVVDDALPSGTDVVRDDGSAGVAGMFETWLFGPGAAVWGVGADEMPVETTRKALAGNGGGQTILTTRQVWAVHPVGYAYSGAAPDGGPANGTGTNNLRDTASWTRVYPERKQIKFARLVTREAP